MAKQKSRPARWAEAAAEARRAFDAVRDASEELTAALDNLSEIQAEYQDWYDNMPEALQEGPTGEKLVELTDLDLNVEVGLDEYEEVIDAAENADLPMGFGRD